MKQFIERRSIQLVGCLLLIVYLSGHFIIENWVFRTLPYKVTRRQLVLNHELRAVVGRLLRFDDSFQNLLASFRNDQPNENVVLLNVDYDVVMESDSWPLPRKVYADIIEKLAELRPKVFVIDSIFEWPQAPWVMEILQPYAARGTREEMVSILSQLNHDGQVKQALAKLDYVLLFLISRPGEITVPAMKNKYIANMARYAKLSPKFNVTGDGVLKLYPYARAHGVRMSILPLQLHAKGQGYSRFNHGRYAVANQVPLFHRLETVAKPTKSFFLPHLVVEAVRVFLDENHYGLNLDHGEATAMTIGEKNIKTDPAGEMIINFYNRKYRSPTKTIRAHDLLNDRVEPETIKGKIVVMGSDTNLAHDYINTPVGRVWGTEIVATSISNILNEDYFYRPRWASKLEVGFLIVIFFMLIFSTARLKPSYALGVALFLIASTLTTMGLLFVRNGQVLSVTIPTTFTGILYLQTSIMRYLKEEQQKRFYKNALGLYLSPELSNQVAENPTLLSLEGKEEELTVLFSDIRGFTTLSESMKPEELTAFLHEYFSPMTDIIFETGGTLDKYIGDAVMAFWGAPLNQEDHALRACDAALGMVEKLNDLRSTWMEKGLPHLEIGIGINSGLMRVGNMGSNRRLSYTVMGDNVNLGSRLEGLTKIYGVKIIASGTTWEKIDHQFYGRQLDRVKVKGKKKAVPIYEIKGKGEATGALYDDLKLWENAQKAFCKRNWSESASAFQIWHEKYKDKTAAYYLSLIEEYHQNPPGPDWQPISEISSK